MPGKHFFAVRGHEPASAKEGAGARAVSGAISFAVWSAQPEQLKSKAGHSAAEPGRTEWDGRDERCGAVAAGRAVRKDTDLPPPKAMAALTGAGAAGFPGSFRPVKSKRK